MTTKEKLLWGAIVIVLGGVGAASYYYFRDQTAQTPENVTAQPPPAPASAEPAIRNPVPGDGQSAGTQPLPPLAESDAGMLAALTQFFGEDSVAAFLVRTNIVRNVVVTVDNLPRQKVAVERRPVKATSGQAVTSGDADAGEVVTLNVQNYARYVPFIKVVQATDAKQLAALYFHWYPLLQQEYEDQGYPGKYFNDRLVETIDNLLKTPDIAGPIRLVRPKVFYEFADPALEARSAGQKLLIRMGPENAAQIKAKLRELRAEIAGRKP